jgi:hypothetical protein
MKVSILRLVCLLVMTGCGVGARSVVIQHTVQPKLNTMEMPAGCLSKQPVHEECPKEQILLTSETASPGLLSALGQAIGEPGYHSIVHDSNAGLSIIVQVDVTRPAYRGEESQQFHPERCLQFEKRCVNQPGLKRCLSKAKQLESSYRRRDERERCRTVHRKCIRICTSVQKSYTEFRLSESCESRVSLHARRLVDRSGEAVGDQGGLSLGQPSFDGESTSRLIEKNQKPKAVGAQTMCRRAFDNAVAQVPPWFNPSKLNITYVFANLEPAPYQSALLDLQFGRYERAHQQLDETFRQAGLLGLDAESVSWVHHVKATTFFLQGDLKACNDQLRLAAKLNAQLLDGYGSYSAGVHTPLESYRKLMGQCVVREAL